MLPSCLRTEWTLLVLLLFAPGQGLFIAHETNIVIHIHVTIYGACKRSTWQVQAFPVFFQLHILPCSFLQLHSSCIPVANSSCKFYLHWGKHSQARQSLKSSLLVLCWLFFAPANASPNVNRICNWNLQLECNWNATAGNCTGEYATGKTQEKLKQRYSVNNIFYLNCQFMQFWTWCFPEKRRGWLADYCHNAAKLFAYCWWPKSCTTLHQKGFPRTPWMLTLQLLKSRKNKQFWMAEILHHLGCQPNFEIMGVAGGSIKDAIMHDMAGGAGFQPSTVS